MADQVPTPDGTPAPDPTAPPAAAPAAPDRTFTQAEIDSIVKDRLKREREKYQDYDTLKSAADELARIKESQLSETEKLTKKLAELEAAKTQAESRTRDTLIRSAVVAEAAKLNFWNPEQAHKLIDMSTLTIADNGEVEGAAEAVKALAESQKYLIKSSSPANFFV